MKLFHISDLHIGLKLYNRDLSENQAYVFKQITELAAQEKPDAFLIAGDIYNCAVPSADAVGLFNSFITELSEAIPCAEIMIISGNHDSAPRVDLFRKLLAERRIHMIGMPPVRPEEHIEKVTLNDEYGNVNFYLLPFVKPSMIKMITGTYENGNNLSYNDALHALINREDIDRNERNIIVSHQFYLSKGRSADEIERMDSEVRTVGNIDEVSADVLEPFDYAALGHIHKPMSAGNNNFRYCGTPVACSVSEAGQEKGIIVAEIGKKNADGVTDIKTSVLPLIPLRRIKVIKGEFADVLAQSCDDFVSVRLTDKKDIDIMDMHDRLRSAFPYLLEIQRENIRTFDSSVEIDDETVNMDPFDMCCSFIGASDDEEKDLLRDIINTVREADS